MDERLPTIRLELGDEITKVQAQSSFRFKLGEIADKDLIGANTPVVFEYLHSSCRFTLPPSRFVGLDVNFGHAVNATVSPHLNQLTIVQAFQLLSQLTELFSHSGWSEVPGSSRSVRRVREMFDDPTAQTELKVGIGKWRCGDDELYVTLKRSWRAGDRLPAMSGQNSDLFIVSIDIDNDPIRRHYDQEMTKARIAAGLPPWKSRRIKLPTVEPASR